MKVIYVEQLNKITKANIFDGVIEKGDGIYKKVMDAFPGDTEHAKTMVSELQEEEMEKQLAQEALQNRPPDPQSIQLNTDELTESQLRISDAISMHKDVKIGYFTYASSIYIEREIKPEYIYYAETTRNNVLVSWCYDWNDYRAFILDNIVFVEDINNKPEIG